MAAVTSRKLYFHNIGYCKYKDRGCKNYHPEEKCVVINCADRECPKRHQKYCRYKTRCQFQSNQRCELLLTVYQSCPF